MPSETRLALRELIDALEHHHEMTRNADVVTDAVFEDAEARLQDAFFTYDDLLFTEWGVELPLELVDDFEDEEDEDESEDDFEEDDLETDDSDIDGHDGEETGDETSDDETSDDEIFEDHLVEIDEDTVGGDEN